MKLYKCYGAGYGEEFERLDSMRYVAGKKRPDFDVVEDMTRELLTGERIGEFLMAMDAAGADPAMQCYVDALLHNEKSKLTRNRRK